MTAPNSPEHIAFHQQEAESARKMADKERVRYIRAPFDSEEARIATATEKVFDGLAQRHNIAASGVLAFADCPTCHQIDRRKS